MSAPSRAVAIREPAQVTRWEPVAGIEVQLPEVGRLRLGGPQEPIVDKGKPRLKDGKPVMKMGRPLEFFRATAAIREDLEELARVYGDPQTIESWQSPDGPQWQTVLTAAVLPIALPPYTDTLVGPRYETYNAAHYLTRHCDGRSCWVPNKEAKRWESRGCVCAPESPECSLVTRLKVVVLGVPAHGVWRVECHGAYAARHWPAQVDQAMQLAVDGQPVRATIRIEPKTGRSAIHGKSHYRVPVLRLEEAIVGPTGPELDTPKNGKGEPVKATLPPPSEPIPPDDDPIDAEATEVPPDPGTDKVPITDDERFQATLFGQATDQQLSALWGLRHKGDMPTGIGSLLGQYHLTKEKLDTTPLGVFLKPPAEALQPSLAIGETK